jgi:hypothetical protein
VRSSLTTSASDFLQEIELVLLRRANSDLLASSEIVDLAELAEMVKERSLQAKQFADGDGRFADLFSAKTLKHAFRDEDWQSLHIRQIETRFERAGNCARRKCVRHVRK